MKKGFTLVELLAIIVLLSLVALIIFPNLIASFEQKQSEIDQATIDILYSSTDEYIKNHEVDYDGPIGTVYCIPISDIDDEGLIPIDVTNYYDQGIEVKIGETNNRYKITTCAED